MAAGDLKTKKRKGAPDAAPKPKKQKKTDETAATAPKKSSRAHKAAVEPIDSLAAKVKPTRKRAEDFFNDDDDDDEEAPAKAAPAKEKKPKKKSKIGEAADMADAAAVVVEVKEKSKKAKKDKESAVEAMVEIEAGAPKAKSKKGKKAKQPEEVQAPAAEADIIVAEDVPVVTEVKKSKKATKSKKQMETPEEDVAEAIVEAAVEDEEELDDQTAALLAGFESERDESDLEKEDAEIDEEAVPKLTKKQRKALENVRKDSEPGVVFLGRIPHGFFEPQMKKYFSQFGNVNRLRLSRNKKTGASKHYAFIEFAHGEVANIVAQTMHNYLMFGHILQCRVIPPEQVHQDLFKGANERFKVDPRNKKAGVAMARGAERAVWEKRVKKANQKRAAVRKALKDEFDYELSAPAVTTVDAVPKKTLAVEDQAEQQLIIEAPAAETAETVQVTEPEPGQITVTETVETVKTNQTKKTAKSKPGAELDATRGAQEEPVLAIKGKKGKKRKSDVVAEQIEEVVTPPISKMAKKDTKVAEGEIVPEKKRKTKVADQDGAKPKKAKKAKA